MFGVLKFPNFTIYQTQEIIMKCSEVRKEPRNPKNNSVLKNI